jgi:hypothetical protein
MSDTTVAPMPVSINTPLPASASSLTAEAVFGENPWLENPSGTGPTGTFPYNPDYFATAATAALVAAMVGGTVVSVPDAFGTAGSPVTSNQPMLMVVLGGGLINPGLVATFFTHGYPLAMIEGMIQKEVFYAGRSEIINIVIASAPAPVPAPTTIIGSQFGPGMYNFARNTVLGPQGGTIGGQPVQAWAGMKVQGIDPETKLPLKLTAIVYPSPTPGISQYDGWLQVE